ncbi:MAG: Kelch repeat-containing protein [Gemmatimonadales bacterium]
MTPYLTRPTGLVLTLLVFAACDPTPTEPSAAASALAEAELAVGVNSWTSPAPMPSDRYWPAVAVVPNSQGQSILYAIGGSRDVTRVPLGNVQAYNAATNHWTSRAALPVALYNTNGAGAIDGKIYVTGGMDYQNRIQASVYMYDPATNQWTRKKDMPARGFGGITGVYQNRLYVMTSCDNVPNCATERGGVGIFRYNPATDNWRFLSPAHGDHVFGMGGFLGGKFYLTGGVSAEPRASLDVYDPATNSWQTGAPMPAGRTRAAYATIEGKLYLAGGSEEDLTSPNHDFVQSRSVIRYDPVGNKWSTLAPLPKAQQGLSGGRVVVTSTLRFEVVGGPRPGNNFQYTP